MANLFVMLEVARFKFLSKLATLGRDLIEKFKEKNLAKVSFLKILSKENPLECFY